MLIAIFRRCVSETIFRQMRLLDDEVTKEEKAKIMGGNILGLCGID